MTLMDRSVLYQINSLEKPQKISGFLKEKGYSRQNLVDLRKDEQAICLNGTYVHMNHMLAEGDVLTVWIRETENSGQIRPVKLPFAIVYEDEDLLVINKPAGMPVHPSRGNPENSLGNALAWYFKEQGGSLCVPLYQPAGPGYLRAYYCGKTCGFCGDPRADGAGKSRAGTKSTRDSPDVSCACGGKGCAGFRRH